MYTVNIDIAGRVSVKDHRERSEQKEHIDVTFNPTLPASQRTKLQAVFVTEWRCSASPNKMLKVWTLLGWCGNSLVGRGATSADC